MSKLRNWGVSTLAYHKPRMSYFACAVCQKKSAGGKDDNESKDGGACLQVYSGVHDQAVCLLGVILQTISVAPIF